MPKRLETRNLKVVVKLPDGSPAKSAVALLKAEAKKPIGYFGPANDSGEILVAFLPGFPNQLDVAIPRQWGAQTMLHAFTSLDQLSRDTPTLVLQETDARSIEMPFHMAHLIWQVPAIPSSPPK